MKNKLSLANKIFIIDTDKPVDLVAESEHHHVSDWAWQHAKYTAQEIDPISGLVINEYYVSHFYKRDLTEIVKCSLRNEIHANCRKVYGADYDMMKINKFLYNIDDIEELYWIKHCCCFLGDFTEVYFHVYNAIDNSYHDYSSEQMHAFTPNQLKYIYLYDAIDGSEVPAATWKKGI